MKIKKKMSSLQTTLNLIITTLVMIPPNSYTNKILALMQHLVATHGVAPRPKIKGTQRVLQKLSMISLSFRGPDK